MGLYTGHLVWGGGWRVGGGVGRNQITVTVVIEINMYLKVSYRIFEEAMWSSGVGDFLMV